METEKEVVHEVSHSPISRYVDIFRQRMRRINDQSYTIADSHFSAYLDAIAIIVAKRRFTERC